MVAMIVSVYTTLFWIYLNLLSRPIWDKRLKSTVEPFVLLFKLCCSRACRCKCLTSSVEELSCRTIHTFSLSPAFSEQRKDHHGPGVERKLSTGN